MLINREVEQTCDIVIIGAGIGGLIAGIELARAGLSVVILERHFQVGGCCTSFKRKGFLFDAGAHLLGGVGNNRVPVGLYLSKLNVDIDFIRCDPMDTLTFPDFSIQIPGDVDQYIETLQKNFPQEDKNIHLFFKEMKKIYLYFAMPKSSIMDKYADLTYQQMLNQYFISDKLKTILSSQSCYLGSAPKHISALAMCMMLSSYLYCGTYFPKGGSGAFANALGKKFEQLGGKLYLTKNVNQIVVKNGEVKQVVYNNGDEIKAKIVVSNGDIKNLFFNLIDRECDYTDSFYVERIKHMKESISLFITYLGVDIPTSELEGKLGWWYDAHDLNDNENIPLFITLPSLWDPDLAPQNMNIIEIYTKMPEDQPINNYMQWKSNFEKEIIDRMENFIPNLSNRIVFKESATSQTIERYTMNSNGSAYGWAATPDQVGKNYLPNRTPIKNLFQVGHWSYPGAGIMAVFISGLVTARQIINDLKGSKR